MSRSFRMKSAVVGTCVVALGLSLGACSPPREQPSETKLDNATSAAAPSQATPSQAAEKGDSTTPVFLTCGGTPVMQPSVLDLACGDAGDTLKDIQWQSWTEEGAQGTATRETVERPGATPERHSNVSVQMLNPRHSAAGLVFQQVRVGNDTFNAEIPSTQ